MPPALVGGIFDKSKKALAKKAIWLKPYEKDFIINLQVKLEAIEKYLFRFSNLYLIYNFPKNNRKNSIRKYGRFNLIWIIIDKQMQISKL